MRNGLTTPKRRAKGEFVPLWVLIIAFFVILFAPIPFRYEIVNCAQPLRYPDQSRPCPGGLILGWSPSIAQGLYKRMQIRNMEPPEDTTPTPPSSQQFVGAGCKLGGCNSEICQNEDEETMASPCVIVPGFGCYKTGRCEKQTDGQCGWTQTQELQSCLEKFSD